MKQVYLIISVLFIFFKVQAQEAGNEKLVLQLQLLKSVVLANNKQAVSSFFRFPLTNVNLIRKAEGFEKKPIPKKIDRKYFLQHYNRMFTAEVKEMFKQLDVDRLEEQAELIVEMPPKSKTDYCSRRYEMVFLNNQLSVSFLLNTRQDITIPEASYCEEYAEFWQFNWKRGKLLFDALEVAG